MKTTVELPDALFRQAKAAAAAEGKTLKELFSEALRARVDRRPGGAAAVKPWERGFGGLRHLHKENLRIDRLIAEEFGTVDEEQWR